MEQSKGTGIAQHGQGGRKQLPVEGQIPLAQTAPLARIPLQRKRHSLLRLLGPGFLSGMAGNDATGITTYSIDGAKAGYGHLWLLLLATPMYQAVQFACARIGRVTGMGLADNLRKQYGRSIALLVVSVLVVANVALIAGDLVAIGSGLELLTGISWAWFVAPVAVLLWYLIVHHSFEAITRIFSILSLAFVTYLITALFSGANWGAVLAQTFVPQFHFNLTDLGAAVALLGATISPYSMFWQADSEREQRRTGSLRQQLRCAAFDVASGVFSGNLIAYAVIVTTATTLFTRHRGIQTAADAAQALTPLLGPYAKYLFAIGLIGAGFIAIPVLLASTSYAVAGACGWPSGLSKKLWQREGIEFYLILTGALLVSLVVALLHVDPIQLIFWANVLVGVLAPILVIAVIIVGNNRRLMRNRPLGWPTNCFLVLTVIILIATAMLFFHGLLTGGG